MSDEIRGSGATAAPYFIEATVELKDKVFSDTIDGVKSLMARAAAKAPDVGGAQIRPQEMAAILLGGANQAVPPGVKWDKEGF